MKTSHIIKIKECYNIFNKYHVWSDDENTFKSNFKRFSLVTHPDKGGDAEIFKSVSSCRDILLNDFNKFKEIAKQPMPQTIPQPKPQPKPQHKPQPKPQPKPQ